ncbi:hypothetical protein L195_g051972, partial [Trifolium pratense]
RWNAKDETVRPAYDAYKKDIWDKIRSAFEIGDEHYDYVMTAAGTCLRAFRTKLTTEYLRGGDGNVIRQRPSKYSHVIEQEHWDIFVARRETEEFQQCFAATLSCSLRASFFDEVGGSHQVTGCRRK